MRILIIGSSGLLGSTMKRVFCSSDHEIISHGLSNSGSIDIQADITNLIETEEILLKVNPEIIINLSCLSDVDECEHNRSKAYNLNVLTTKNICQVIADKSIETKFIQISTDQIYDGTGPQREEQIKILNHYSETKVESEKIAMSISGTIFRTNFFGKSNCRNRESFSDWIRSSLLNKNVKYFHDVYFNPLSMTSLSEIILKSINHGLLKGIYNLGSKGGMSKFEFAQAIAEKEDIALTKERSISIDNLKMPAKRSKGMIMDCSKLERSYCLSIPSLSDEIIKYA